MSLVTFIRKAGSGTENRKSVTLIKIEKCSVRLINFCYNQSRSKIPEGEGDMTKADRNLLDYIVVCISEFANRYEMQIIL